jgi:hypothetical protein
MGPITKSIRVGDNMLEVVVSSRAPRTTGLSVGEAVSELFVVSSGSSPKFVGMALGLG